MKKWIISVLAIVIILGFFLGTGTVSHKLLLQKQAENILHNAEDTGAQANKNLFAETKTRTQNRKQEALKSDKTALISNVVWADDNTLFLDGELFGFDHRIETFLFIGTDASGNESATDETYRGAMADFLLLLVLDYTDNTYGAIQIDRNTVTEVTKTDENGEVVDSEEMQICTAHWYGADPEQSAVNTVRTTQMFLGELENIDGYFVLNMQDIGKVNNLVGGVEVTIEDDGMEAVDPAFVKGTTLTLSDEQANAYIRARMTVGEGDNKSRMRRQKAYMDSFFEKAQQKIKDNPNFAQQMWNELKTTSVTDMVGNDVSRIAEMIRSGENKGILTPGGVTRIGTILEDGLEHEEFYPDPEAVKKVMENLFSLVSIEDEIEEE